MSTKQRDLVEVVTEYRTESPISDLLFQITTKLNAEMPKSFKIRGSLSQNAISTVV